MTDIVPRSKYAEMAGRGRNMIAAETAEALDTGGDAFSVFLAYAESTDIPISTVAEVAAILTRINAAARDKKPMPMIGGPALTEDEINAVFATRAGKLKFDAQGNLVGAQQITDLKKFLTRLEQSLPGMQAMGATDDLVARITYIVQELQRPRPAMTPAPSADTINNAKDEARLEILTEIGNEINEDRGERTLARFKLAIIANIRRLASTVTTLTQERDTARNQLADVSTALGNATNDRRGAEETPYAHIQRVLPKMEVRVAPQGTPPPANQAQQRQGGHGQHTTPPPGAWRREQQDPQTGSQPPSNPQPAPQGGRRFNPLANPGN